MNRVIITGNLTKDPEARTTQSGVAVTTFTVAVNRRFINQQTGPRDADFFNIVTWRQLAELCAKYLAKGRKVAVVGSIQNRTWEDADGNKHYATEIIADEVEFLTSHKADGAQEAAQEAPADVDDELPFE